MANLRIHTLTQDELNLRAFRGQITRTAQGRIIEVTDPPPHFQATVAPDGSTQVRIVFGKIPIDRVPCIRRRYAAFPYSGMERNRTSDRW